MNDNSEYIAGIYREMELELIRGLKKNFALHIAEEKKTGLEYPQWQAVKLKELMKFQRENSDIIASHEKVITKEISAHIQKELHQGRLSEIKRFREALGEDRFRQAKAQRNFFFGIDEKKAAALIGALDDDLKDANTAVLRMMNDTYRQTIFKYSLFVQNGVYTEKQAFDAAVKDFLTRGLNCIEYKDGRRVNIASYASMAIRTANQRAYMVGQGELRKELGIPFIEISKHNTSCELCKPFEEKVLIDDVYSGGKPSDGDYMLLSEAMSKGLYHPNCRHGSSTYVPGIFGGEEKDRASQGDRSEELYIDNMIQKYKRLKEGSMDSENVARYAGLLDRWEERKRQLKTPEGVEKSAESGIISKEEMYRKVTPIYRKGIKAISDKRFEQLSITAKKGGATIFRGGEEIEEHLRQRNASAATFNDIILFRQDVSVSDVLEETYHFIQNKIGLNDDKPEPLRSILNEIDAKEYILKNSKKYKVPRNEIEETKRHLKYYKEKLEKLKKGDDNI